ncbi:MAG TPA: PD-(D/E)XK nuclease family protein [Acidobacteriaceae bacterium]|nr:PD-(D/E)XK nuclease family protein [Acidobacteriaceae bacterium]
MANAAWSFSRIESSETCPRKFFHLSVAKDLKEEETSYQIEGKETHIAFAKLVKNGIPLPLHLRHHGPMLTKIAALPGEKIVEQQLALNANWQVVDWFARDAWLRVISDLTQLNGSAALVWDWKTGKPKDDFTQLRLNAAVTMHLAPEVEQVRMNYYWTKTRQITSDKMVRADLPEFWGAMLKRVQTYQSMHDRQDFPPRPNPFCKGCVVKTCQYWQPRRS